MAIVAKSITYENQFWLQIFGDEARFALIAISPNEKEDVAEARRFIALLDSLLVKSREKLSEDQLRDLNDQAFRAVQDFRKFILHLMGRRLTSNYDINLHPSFLNHIVNDTETYLRILDAYRQNKVPVLSPIDINLDWLMAAYIYALNLADNSEIIFRDTKKKAHEFAVEFLDLYVRAYEMNGFLRTGFTDFPALSKLNTQVYTTMRSFAEFVLELFNETSTREVVINLTPLYVDYLYRMICYYMTKLSTVSKVPAPVCDPTAPRRE